MKRGWIITRDYLAEEYGDESDDVGLMGPRDVPYTAEELRAHGKPFRMLDDDGILYYEGFSIPGNDFGPLDDYGTGGAGCTEIQYRDDAGNWRRL
jgi:hypothetical protein